MKNRLIEYWERSGLIKDNNVLKAFKEVPREEFVLDELIREAYSDYPLPIGAGQTISQPSTIMIML
ncbi:MAG: protein-L-isoaspartate O-methyltransferase, partial [Nanoarchaeota archaeon]|nr:protein-L-isoaspartate O-methyltransferase [Nanoarchaeota archaeon]